MDHRQPPRPQSEFFWQDGPYHGHDEWWHAPLHAFFVLLLVALLVVGVIWLVRRLSPGVVPTGAVTAAAVNTADPAVATLRMRYAKGEVSREDYRAAIDDLTGQAPIGPWPGDSPTEDAPTES